MTSCIVGKKIRAIGLGPLELFPFVFLVILMALAGGISEHMLTSWSSYLFLMSPPFKEWWKGHIVLPLSVRPSPSVSNTSLSFSGPCNLL